MKIRIVGFVGTAVLAASIAPSKLLATNAAYTPIQNIANVAKPDTETAQCDLCGTDEAYRPWWTLPFGHGKFETHGLNAIYYDHNVDNGSLDDLRIDLDVEHTNEIMVDLGKPSRHLFWLEVFRTKLDFQTNNYSAPVVPREMNGGGELRYLNLDYPNTGSMNYYGFGYLHLSNGQFVDSSNSVTFTAAFQGTNGNVSDHISRGWDYFHFSAGQYGERHWGQVAVTSAIDEEYRLFTGRQFFNTYGAEEDDWWDKNPSHPHLADYDSFTMTPLIFARFRSGDGVGSWAYLKYKADFGNLIGQSQGLKSVTSTITLGFQFILVPAYVYYSWGYLHNLSMYESHSHNFGIGLSLMPF